MPLILSHPQVIAWICGHIHAHRIRFHQAPKRPGGLWEISTASLIDWPQQWRIIEVLAEGNGDLAIATTVRDHAAPLNWRQRDITDPATLAALSRELAANDYRGRQRPNRFAYAQGRPADRHTTLRLPNPLRSA